MKVHRTKIPGLLRFELDTAHDERGSFCELMQLRKLRQLGLPQSFSPVQSNLSTSAYGTIRGIHAEPWSKYIVPIRGTVFAAIVDLRKGSRSYGEVELFPNWDASSALFVPAGCGNSFAVLSEEVHYLYNVDEFWSPKNPYPAVKYDDPILRIPWPIPVAERIVSQKDLDNPPFVP